MVQYLGKQRNPSGRSGQLPGYCTFRNTLLQTSGRELLCVVLGRLSKAFNVGKIKKKIVYEGLSNAMAAYQS